MNNKNKILIPLPSYGFDPTEVAIPWKILTSNNFEVIFVTPQGDKAHPDKLMLTGEKLFIWKKLLVARKDAVKAFYEMIKSDSFKNPKTYDVNEEDYSGILLPGGHDKGIKEYLESKYLQNLIVDFFKSNKPVGAICHGVILVARSINFDTGRSVIYDYKTTSLLKSQELLGYNLTKLWLKNYYLTYPNITVEEEVLSVLSDKSNFIYGSKPILRDDFNHLERGFVVKDRNYLSARWPGDVYNFAINYIKMFD